jgi:periplasmic protein TonB
MMTALERLTPYFSDTAAAVVTAVAVGLFVLTMSSRVLEVRPQSQRVVEFQLALQMEEPPPPAPTAPPPPTPHKVLTRHVKQVAPEPEPLDPVPTFSAASASEEVPSVAAQVAAAAVSDPNLDAEYAAQLHANIERRTIPPDSWQYRLHHPAGEVRVQFVVTRAGEPRAVALLHSSGSEVLDNAALNIVSSGHYAQMPAKAFVGEAQHAFMITIEFRPVDRARP